MQYYSASQLLEVLTGGIELVLGDHGVDSWSFAAHRAGEYQAQMAHPWRSCSGLVVTSSQSSQVKSPQSWPMLYIHGGTAALELVSILPACPGKPFSALLASELMEGATYETMQWTYVI